MTPHAEADGAVSDRFAPFPEPAPETLAFNARLQEVFDAAPRFDARPIPEVRALRAAGEGLLPIFGPLSGSVWATNPHAVSPHAAEVRVSTTADPRLVYLHIHGGGWTYGAPDQFDGRNQALAAAADAHVVSAKYRLAPEHPWPACADDCFAAAQFALGEAARLGVPLTIGGESAGAHLAAVTLLRLRDAGLGPVAGAALIYGSFDLFELTPSARNWGERPLVLSTPIIQWFGRNLHGAGDHRNDPYIAPLRADLSGMPPALLQCGTMDPLLDDTAFMAARWRAAGADAEALYWPGGVHAFDTFDRPEDGLPIAGASTAATAAFLRRCAA